LISVAADASPRSSLAWDAAGLAATVAYQTGLPEACAKARAALDALGALGEPVTSAEDRRAGWADEHRIWITACTDPFGGRAETVPYVHRVADGSVSDPCKVGGAAWILDETELAVRVLREGLSQISDPGVRGASGGVLSALEGACIDSGRWDEALAAAREASDIAAAYQMETVACLADLATATVAAMRGDPLRRAPGRSCRDTWPFERAQLQLDYGEWLRRQRRINDAKPVLSAALETFRRLGAVPWATRAEAELRACGVVSQAAPTNPDALDGLTAQQREIVILAGRGLTNTEIADRLFLSPRTVASHPYRSYPKLGIAGRHQIHDLIDHQGTLKAGA
jgi:DNA-binding CsgD family transcriptional regulator